MDASHMEWVLKQFGAVRVGQECRSACPVHQPSEPDHNRWKLVLSPGGTRPLILFCWVCCEKGNREKNRAYFGAACRTVGVNPTLFSDLMDAGQIRLLWSRIGITPASQNEETAPDATLNEVYGDLLSRLTLSSGHRKWLERKGMDPDWAEAAGYKSAPTDPSLLVPPLWEKWGFRLATVPGFTSGFEGKTRLLTRQEAVLIPCRNTQGQILALKQRLLDGGPARLRLLGNSRDGGPKSRCVCHCPLGVGGHRWSELWVTEGERKADVHWIKMGIPTVGVPGTGTASTAYEVVTELLAEGGTLVLALDRDDQPQTKSATETLAQWGKEKGFLVRVADWTGAKGLDDAIVRGREVTTRAWVPAERNSTSLQLSAEPLLRDCDILPYIPARGRVVRRELPLRFPSGQEHLISKWIHEGKLRVVAKTDKGQLLESV